MEMTIRRLEAAPCGCCPSDREAPLEGLHQRLASLEADRKAAAEAVAADARTPMRGTGDPWMVGPAGRGRDGRDAYGVLVRLDDGWWRVTEGGTSDFGLLQARHITRQLRKGYHYDLEPVL